MPATRAFSFALTLTLLCAPAARGQAGGGSVAVSGHVSEAVFLSAGQGTQAADGRPSFTHSRLSPQALLISVSATGGESGERVSVPLRLRSNVGYRLSVSAGAGAVRGLCVEGLRASGRFVAAAAVAAAVASPCGAAKSGPQAPDAARAAEPAHEALTLLSGPAISLSGTSDSPFNALEVWLVVEVGPDAGGAELTLTASPAGRAAAPAPAHGR